MSREVIPVSVIRVDCAQDSEMVFTVTGSPVAKENRTYDLTQFSDTVQMNRLLKKRYGVFTATERQCSNAQELCDEAANAFVWEELNIDALNSNFWAGGSGLIWQHPGDFAGIQGDDITRGSGTDAYLYLHTLSAQAGSPTWYGDQQMMLSAQQPWFEANPEYAGRTVVALRVVGRAEAVGTVPGGTDFALFARVAENQVGNPSPHRIAGPDEARNQSGQRIFTHNNESGVVDFATELDLTGLPASPNDFGIQYDEWETGVLNLNIWWLADDNNFTPGKSTITIRLYEVGLELVFA